MNLFEAIFLGFVQGATEFLPISSSGHLAILKNLFGLKDIGLLFDVVLHLGTLVAICLVYWRDVVKLFINGIGIIIDFFYNIYIFINNLGGKKLKYRKIVCSAYRKFAMLIIVSTIPTGIIGIVTGNLVDAVGKSLIVPGICLFITGVILLICDELPLGNKTPKGTTYFSALLVGIAQGFAVLPGVSRSGTTITACQACGFRKDFAVKYSFIMSIPAILGATVLELKDVNTASNGGPVLYYIIGAFVAAIVGYFCIKLITMIVKRQKFKYFSYYCFALGTFSIITYFIK